MLSVPPPNSGELGFVLTTIVVVERMFWTEIAFLSIEFGSSSNP